MKVYIVNGHHQYRDMFKARGHTIVDDIDEADLVQFTGGEDVNPELYNSPCHRTTMFSEDRDEYEMQVYRMARDRDIPLAGICRGGQFLNVMNGGTLYQDVDNHTRNHLAMTYDGDEIEVTSTHHQMMRPDDDGIVLLSCMRSTRREYFVGLDPVVDIGQGHVDVEAVFYPETQTICFQPHPEYLNKDSDCQEYYFKLLNEYLEV